MASEKESNGRKESVKIRQRKLSDGTISLYLDIQHNGKRTREFLKLYLKEEKSRADKEYNRQIMAQAETIRSQRQIEVQSKQYEVLHEFKMNTYFGSPAKACVKHRYWLV